MKKVDFIVIGAGKAGTTWLWHVLHQHPQCYLPIEKELSYFNREPAEPIGRDNPNYNKSLAWYHSHFKNINDSKCWGDISPAYLWSDTAPSAIKSYNENIKLVVILRHPVERAYSHYLYRQQKGLIGNISFSDAIEEAPFMLERSLYGRYLNNYLQYFDRSQILILFYDDVKKDPRSVIYQIENFLGIDQWYLEEFDKPVNITGRSRYPFIVRIVARIDLYARALGIKDAIKTVSRHIGLLQLINSVRNAKDQTTRPASLAQETKQKLVPYFYDDMKEIEIITGRDLKAWRNV